MKKLPLLSAIALTALLSISAFAQMPAPKSRPAPGKPAAAADATKPRIPPVFVERILPGKPFLVVDATKDGCEGLEDLARNVQKLSTMITTYRRDPAVAPTWASASNLLKDEATIVVIAYDGAEGEPPMTVWPESRAALLNVPAAIGESTNRMFRLEVELWRSLGLSSGGFMPTQPTVMRPVFSREDVDRVGCRSLSPGEWGTVTQHARKAGVSIQQRAMYAAAVRQGWAPAPTNDLMKAIYDRETKRMADLAAAKAAKEE